MLKITQLVLVLLILSRFSFAQTTDSTNNTSHFSGNIGITNNGISLIPTFSLNRPAGIVLLSMGKKKFSFDPDIRFSLSGKPWSFIFWFRYRAISSNKFSLRLGTHPAMNFRTEDIIAAGELREQIIARRYLAAEVVPDFHINKHTSIGMYYLTGRGFDKGGVRYSHFLTLNGNFSDIKISDQFRFGFSPQVFYLRLEKDEGYFATGTIVISKKNFPFSLSAIFNKELKKGIPGARDFIWNTTLTYSFAKKYTEK